MTDGSALVGFKVALFELVILGRMHEMTVGHLIFHSGRGFILVSSFVACLDYQCQGPVCYQLKGCFC